MTESILNKISRLHPTGELPAVLLVPGAVAEQLREDQVVERVIDVPVIKEHEVRVDRAKFRDVNVDVIKPHYKCQVCGNEV